MPVPDRTSKLDGQEKPVSRLERLQTDHKDVQYQPEMPPIEAGNHLIDYLWEIGPVMPGGMSAAPLSHGELAAWQGNTGIELQPWEARFLRRLSQDYLAESHRAEKPDCPAPWAPGSLSQSDREAISRKVQNAMRSFLTAQRKPA